MLYQRFSSMYCVLVFILFLASSPVFAATQSGTLSGAAGEYQYYDITLPSPQSGVRLVLSSDLATDFYLYTGTSHLAGTHVASSSNKTLHTLLVDPASLTAGGSYHVRIRAASGLATAPFSYSFTDDMTYYRDLTWDPGTSLAGTAIMNQPDTAGGDYYFRITSQASVSGAWRNALRVTGGEADLYMQQSSPPAGGGSYSSVRAGSDGFVLAGGQFAANQTWYIRVHATPGATWQLYSGDIYVHDLGTVAADASSSSPTVTIGPEGTYYFSTTVDAATQAWRLWLNNSSLPIYVKKLTAPVSTSQSYHEQYEQGQMLLVPPYLTNASYFVGITGAPGSSFALDSRKQQILIPSALPGYSQGSGLVDFDFNLTGETNGGGFGYRTYRIDVPIDQIAWQVNVTPTSGNPELYVRKAEVPNRWMNNGLSEAPAGVGDSITQVPPTLTNGVWYVTVYGTATFSYTLTSGNPTVTGSTFINTADPNPVPPGYAYPYNTVPITNNEINRSGWRYYQVSNIDSQLGFLGWQLDLANQVPGSEIAIRRNAVPSRWFYRNGGSVYSTYVSEANQADVSSTLGFLQHPGHPADIWYIGVSTPNQALGAFQLTTREIPAPQQNFTQGSQNVAGQLATTWKWFKYTVPLDANLLGWDLRLKASGGTPRMVVRRDQLPAAFGSSYYQNMYGNWPTGNQWEGGADWTGRNYITYSSVTDKNKYLVMGMGSPLEPGTYYVGVSGADTMSYTLESRGIGIGNDSGGTPWPIQVADLGAFNGGSVNGSGLAPREAAYYRVTVPAGTTSWSVRLNATVGESLLLVRQGRLPNISAYTGMDTDNISYFTGTLRQKNGTEYFYKYQPSSGATTITPGVYYLAVVSEGQNPFNAYTIGTGNVSYTLTSEGTVPVNDKTGTPVTAVNPVSWVGETQAYGQQKVYRFRVPAGLTSIEVRLRNRVGNPFMAMRQDTSGSGLIPYPVSPGYQAQEGGRAYTWNNDTLITLAQPVEGDYTVVVSNQSLYINGVGYTYPDAGYDLEVRALVPIPMAVTGGVAASGSLIDQQVAYYQVDVPATVNGQSVLGWLLKSAVSNGAVSMRVRKDLVPGINNTGAVVSPNSAITVVPPVLTPGTWYVEVKGAGITDYTLRSDIVSADPAKHRRTWFMPPKVGAFTQAGLPVPYFGDSGIDDLGQPIINPDTGDQGTDLAKGEWHFYRVTVPDNNSALLRTVVEALSGTPQLYLRSGNVPSIDHYANPVNPTQGPTLSYDRYQSLPGTMYGNWVPLDGKTEKQLTPGDWWICVRAVTTNIRYRLKVAAGDIYNSGGARLDSIGYVQDLAQNGGSVTGQNLAAKDMRYYRITVPQSSATLGSSTPLAWNLTLTQQVGDVVIFVRDTIPPGQGADGNAGSTLSYSDAASTYFQDWYDDNSYVYPNPYPVIDSPGFSSLSLPPVEPGKTYYLGVYARTDATFDISSIVGGSNLAVTAVLPFTNGTDSRTLAAGEEALYRIDVPSNGVLWHHNSTNAAGIQLYLGQGTVPPQNSYAHWRSNSAVNTVFNQSLNGFPWQPGHSYYLLVKNTTAGALPFSITMDGRTTMAALDITMAGNGAGNITSSPNLITCTTGTCSAQIVPYTPITLYRAALAGSTFTGWSGDCTGTGNCALTMNVPHSVTATFALNSYTVTTTRVGNGSITSVPAGIDCKPAGTCSAGFLYGTSITLIATPDAGNGFVGWSGACTGNGSCTFTVGTSGNSVTATFAPLRLLTVTVAGAGGGSVTSVQAGVPTGIACTASSGSCTASYTSGSSVDLLQNPDVNSTFAGWSGDCTGSGACTVAMTVARNVTATFDQATLVKNQASGTGYSLLQTAYNFALTGSDGNTILARGGITALLGSLNLNRGISVILKGGYDQPFATQPGYTEMQPPLTVGTGSLTVEKLIIK